MTAPARRITAPITLMILAACAAPVAARPRLEAQHLAELDRYEVLSFSDPFQGGIERGKAIGVVDATSEEVFRVATDYARLQEFMPRVQRSVVTQTTGT